MAYSQHEILVTGLKNAYALEAHAADVTEIRRDDSSTTPSFSAECSSTMRRPCASAIGSANA
jgi:hypothetical protein